MAEQDSVAGTRVVAGVGDGEMLVLRLFRSLQSQSAELALETRGSSLPTRPERFGAAPSAATASRPVVFVLPGIMGSELRVDGQHVWRDALSIAMGGFTRLSLGAGQVEAIRLHSGSYGALIEHLADTHEVVPFPYDWRLPVQETADRLAAAVHRELAEAERQGQPVRILAHSMGGLVARAMVARHPDLWAALCRHPGARLLMLGTPNAGSHAINELVVGQSTLLRTLALLDLSSSAAELLRIVCRLPGVLALLPKDEREDYLAANTWSYYHQRCGKGWSPPAERDLSVARELRQLLDRVPADPARMLYVAGTAEHTLAQMRFDAAEGRIRFLATAQGDGRVTWDGGIPPGVPAWFMAVEHGDLAVHEPDFPALVELLENGDTARLPTRQPLSRRVAAELYAMPEPQVDQLPDEAALLAAALGQRAATGRQPSRAEPPVPMAAA